MRKNIPESKMAAMINLRLTRSTLGSQSELKYKGTVVDGKKFRRHIKEITRKQNKAQTLMANTENSTPISLEASKM